MRVTRFLNPPSRRAGRWGSGLPPMGARRVRHASFAACSRLPGSVLLHGNVSPLRMSILSPCCYGYSSSNRGEDQADSSSNKRINVRVPRLAFRTWVAWPPKAPFYFSLPQSLLSPLPPSQDCSVSLVPPSTSAVNPAPKSGECQPEGQSLCNQSGLILAFSHGLLKYPYLTNRSSRGNWAT
jgi:hypothetical protein